MTTLILVTVLADVHFQMKEGQVMNYDSQIVFEGYLPILGGNEGKAEVDLGLKVVGLSTMEKTGESSSEVVAFKAVFNDFELPVSVEDAQEFFPKSSILINQLGEVVKNNAPDKKLPVRLPGLDVKRLPDITFHPVQFSDYSLTEGDSWKFKRSFAGADVNYSCKVSKIAGSLITIQVALTQDYEVFENELIEVVEKKEDAVAQVKTKMTGSGEVLFDQTLGRVVSATIKNQATSRVTPLDSLGKASERKLNSTFTTKLKKVDGKDYVIPTFEVKLPDQRPLWQKGLDAVSSWGKTAIDKTVSTYRMLKTLFQMSLKGVPGGSMLVEGWLKNPLGR